MKYTCRYLFQYLKVISKRHSFEEEPSKGNDTYGVTFKYASSFYDEDIIRHLPNQSALRYLLRFNSQRLAYLKFTISPSVRTSQNRTFRELPRLKVG